ncbi:hypothetical protein [Psychrobium sp. 1_MG-2023]|uniref:hypothetical protein n=1 Tax=Psychrobium sp. 1_MG-2023 TaxID=3062624 RepID=UPI000C349A02|nr:hypothetical protein [Psychrobium sp. 1_MG-2023]MDP2561925.1 hypothetical protein [Psychrobium sp. 1_MG-2023]PKF58692.1 hypothetical protein CW748_03390 [Alteromonadales bacterium alter-6D02]
MKNLFSTISPQHWQILSRIAIALFGGYLITTLSTIAIGLLLGLFTDTSYAIHIGLLLSFTIYAAYAMYCFSSQSVRGLLFSSIMSSIALVILIAILEQVIS